MGRYSNEALFSSISDYMYEADDDEKDKEKEDIGKKISDYKKKDKKSDEDEADPTIKLGPYLVTINQTSKAVQIEDTVKDNNVEIGFTNFDKLIALFNDTDTTPDEPPAPPAEPE
jgi:hypothetical protein